MTIGFETCLQLSRSSSEAVAAQVAVYRALGINKSLAIFCMLELARRRRLGEEFCYEAFIDTEVKKMPLPVEVDILGLTRTLNSDIKSVVQSLKIKT